MGRGKFFFTANSSDPKAQYPVQGYMKFSGLQLPDHCAGLPLNPSQSALITIAAATAGMDQQR